MLRLVPIILPAIAFAACGGGSANTESATTESIASPTTTVVETVTEGTATIFTIDLSSRTFQMPSKNIGCTVSEDVLVCDILSGLKPEPAQTCELDWTGMEMEALGPAQPRCAGDTAYDRSAPVLQYGEHWARGRFSCQSESSGLTCRNGEGHGFTLSRENWSQF